MRATSFAVSWRFALIGLLAMARYAGGQDVVEHDTNLDDRPVSEVRIVGADPADEQLVRNNIRSAVGDPYVGSTVRNDVNRVYNLGKFRFVTAEAMLADDGTVVLNYVIVVQPTIHAVQTIGNKAINDQELRAVIRQVPGGPRDRFLIEAARRDIKAAYRRKGYYLTEVAINESELEEHGVLIFKIIEGPRVRVRAIEFVGGDSFPSKRLQAEIRTRTHVALLRQGVLDEDVLAEDTASLDRFYKGRGFLDVRVGHTVALSPQNTEAKVTFYILEGRVYTLRSIVTENLDSLGDPLEAFSLEQLAAILELKTGDVYSRDKLRESVEFIKEAYGLMGYLDVTVQPSELRSGPEPEVDLLLAISEGERYKVGLIHINGNFLTKDKVIRRLIRVRPGRPYDRKKLERSKQLIRGTRLFNEPIRLTVQEPDLVDPEYRDLLVEIKERNTGSVNFGLAVGSDAGVLGEFSLVQTNFDIADVPASFGELIHGRAFRGAGQRFNMVFRPGDEIFQYSVSLTEPHLFESPYSLSGSGSYRTRVFNDYDEERVSGSVGLTRQLGDIWNLSWRFRAERVELTAISFDAPLEVFRDAGPDTLLPVGITVTRTTVRTITRPGRGSRLRVSVDNFGAVGGDVDFWKTEVDYTVFLTLDEDFLGRTSTLRLRSRVGYIFGGRAPTYERFYLGGRTFRGFDFREISPKGIRADTLTRGDDPVGGEWMVFFGAQYEHPVFQETVTGVIFLDTGTVTEDPGFSEYRVSMGVGIRLYISALGPVPIAFDFGFPIQKQSEDETRVLSFSAELPF